MKLTVEANTDEIKKVLHAIAGSEEHKDVVTVKTQVPSKTIGHGLLGMKNIKIRQ